MKNILALDLGTKTGWAMINNGQRTSGTWTLAQPKEITINRAAGLDRKRDPRFQRLLQHIRRKLSQPLFLTSPHSPLLAFEDVLFSETTLQTQLWSCFRSAVWAASLDFHTLRVECLNTATLKKVSTGAGNATKQAMAIALQRRHPTFFSIPLPAQKNCMLTCKDGTVDDNEVDANHLLDFFIDHE